MICKPIRATCVMVHITIVCPLINKPYNSFLFRPKRGVGLVPSAEWFTSLCSCNPPTPVSRREKRHSCTKRELGTSRRVVVCRRSSTPVRVVCPPRTGWEGGCARAAENEPKEACQLLQTTPRESGGILLLFFIFYFVSTSFFSSPRHGAGGGGRRRKEKAGVAFAQQ